ncbi:hypothetical protein HHL16_04150 [Pseudoflavitalea sp. G-6-1-2]|uniref:hypothetical protein n=1 Tax=Pseudoflavitalea sp. G-6-1-2 TaxID=2728841 RepID=UPI00146A50F6|nr:hypothetical protein [Pseudoflavitalea sp. G-6-1-2]NML20050.1 hypothetical protein [Pseudoflavitalea sp. G-6-1-2]
MKKTTMYHDIHRTKIYSGIYRPSFNLLSFLRSICTVLFIGQSPITTAGYAKRK